MLEYPKIFTDPEWKKLEKSLKVSATGVGQTLRDLEKAHKRLDAGCQAIAKGSAKAAAVKPALDATRVAGEKATNTLHAAVLQTKDQRQNTALSDYEHKLGRFLSELKRLDLASHHGIEDAADRVNDRVKFVVR